MYRTSVFCFVIATLTLGCDRNIEAFDPDEVPEAPDLSAIFPEGAERSVRPELPPVPGAEKGAPSFAEAQAAEVVPSDAPPVRGTLRIAEGLTVPPNAILFLIARRDTGGPPLAVKRVANPEFPLDFALGPDDRMIASMPFEGPLLLTARVDGDGNAMSRNPGDLQGAAAAAVEVGATGVEIVIDEAL